MGPTSVQTLQRLEREPAEREEEGCSCLHRLRVLLDSSKTLNLNPHRTYDEAAL